MTKLISHKQNPEALALQHNTWQPGSGNRQCRQPITLLSSLWHTTRPTLDFCRHVCIMRIMAATDNSQTDELHSLDWSRGAAEPQWLPSVVCVCRKFNGGVKMGGPMCSSNELSCLTGEKRLVLWNGKRLSARRGGANLKASATDNVVVAESWELGNLSTPSHR